MSTYVLIPGAGGQASYWRFVAPDLRARGRDVVAVDLLVLLAAMTPAPGESAGEWWTASGQDQAVAVDGVCRPGSCSPRGVLPSAGTRRTP